MSRIKEKANRFIIRELEKHGIQGIVPSHGEIMVNLFDSKEYTMKELAEKIHRTKPTVTILIDKLVDHGYVTKEKSLEDSRVTYIRLTQKGSELRPIFQEISDKVNGFVYEGLAEPEVIFFEKILLNINQNFDA